MSDIQGLLNSLPIQSIADQLGEDPAAVEQAAAAALPSLIGGLHRNAEDPDGAQSLAHALGDHDSSLIDGGVNLDDVDTHDGEKIARHIFGGNDAGQQLGGGLANNDLVKRLIPILAPIVMAWLMKQVQQKAGGQLPQTESGRSGGGIFGDILGQIFGGGQQHQPSTTGQATGGGSVQQILLDILGQALSNRR